MIRFGFYIFFSIVICTTIMPSFFSAISSAIMSVFQRCLASSILPDVIRSFYFVRSPECYSIHLLPPSPGIFGPLRCLASSILPDVIRSFYFIRSPECCSSHLLPPSPGIFGLLSAYFCLFRPRYPSAVFFSLSITMRTKTGNIP